MLRTFAPHRTIKCLLACHTNYPQRLKWLQICTASYAHTQYITIKPRTDPICDDYHPGQIEHILMQMTGERFDPTISAGRARARIIDVISIE